MGTILWWIIAALVIFWIAGFAMNVVGNLIHILLVVALVLFVVNLFSGRMRT